MVSNRMRTEEARRRAHDKFAKPKKSENDQSTEKYAVFAAIVEKTARLRALRLAKEASDKDAGDREAAEKQVAMKKPARPTAAKGA